MILVKSYFSSNSAKNIGLCLLIIYILCSANSLAHISHEMAIITYNPLQILSQCFPNPPSLSALLCNHTLTLPPPKVHALTFVSKLPPQANALSPDVVED